MTLLVAKTIVAKVTFCFSVQFFHAVKAGENESIANIELNYSFSVIVTVGRIKALTYMC